MTAVYIIFALFYNETQYNLVGSYQRFRASISYPEDGNSYVPAKRW
jgi:hypothetical protein